MSLSSSWEHMHCAGRRQLESVPTLGEWVLNSLHSTDVEASQAGPRSPGRGDGAAAAAGTPASVPRLTPFPTTQIAHVSHEPTPRVQVPYVDLAAGPWT